MNIKDLCEESHRTALEKGWWEHDPGIPEKIALMHSELSEALEVYRLGYRTPNEIWYMGDTKKPEGFGIELADCIIRIADLCQRHGIDLEECLKIKSEYNRSRPHRHGGKKA